jgi:hypothetical protein
VERVNPPSFPTLYCHKAEALALKRASLTRECRERIRGNDPVYVFGSRHVYEDLPFAQLIDHFDAIESAGYSVSLSGLHYCARGFPGNKEKPSRGGLFLERI